MKKRKFNLLLNIAVLCMCVAAIAIGVYSAKTASLNVGGTVGFVAHDCKVKVYGEITGAVDSNDNAITENTDTAKPIFREGTSGTEGKIVTDKQNTSWEFGKIFFTDLNTTDGKDVNDIIFTFVLTNMSEAYDVVMNVEKPTLPSGVDCKIYIGDNQTTEQQRALLLKDKTEITLKMVLSLNTDSVDISTDNVNFTGLTFNFNKSGESGELKPNAITTFDEYTKTVDVTFGSDSGNDTSGNAISYSGEIVVPEMVKVGDVNYLTNTVEFKKADYTEVTSLNVNASKLNNWFGWFNSSDSGLLKVKDISLHLDEFNFNIDEYYYNWMSVNEIYETYCLQNCVYLESFSLICKNNVTIQDFPYDTMEIDAFLGLMVDQQSSGRNIYIEGDTVNLSGLWQYNVSNYKFDKIEIVSRNTEGSSANACVSVKNVHFKNISNIEVIEKFVNSTSIENIVLESDDCRYTTKVNGQEYNIIYDTQTDTVMAGLKGTVIPEGTKIIASNAYEDSPMESIVIPNSVTKIQREAFYNCKSLASVSVPDSVTYLDDSAFSGCENLQSLYIGKGVANSISGSLIRGTNKLTQIVVSSDNATYKSSSNNSYIIEKATNKLVCGNANTTILEDVTAIGGTAFNKITNATIIVPKCVTTIESSAFYEAKDSTITIEPNNCFTDEYYYPFQDIYNCVIELKTITNLPNYTFQNCNDTTIKIYQDDFKGEQSSIFNSSNIHLQFVEGVKTISENVFNTSNYIDYFSGITEITIPSTVEIVSKLAFFRSADLKKVNLASGVNSLAMGAFAQCENLQEIIIPTSVTSFGGYIFEYDYNLSKIYYKGTEAQWNSITKDADWNTNTSSSYNIIYNYTGA